MPETSPGTGVGLAKRSRLPTGRLSHKLYNDTSARTDDRSVIERLETVPTAQGDPELQEDDIACARSFPETRSPFLHKPQSREDLSAMIFAENVEWAGVADSWFGEGPARVGHDACYDLAIDALMMVCWYGRKLPGATLAKVYRAMGASLDALYVAMNQDKAVLNDHILTAVAALSPVDAITTGHSFLVSGHLDGVAMMLASQAAVRPLSSVARRILEFHFCDTYVMAAVRGTASPFEGMDLSYCEYTDGSKPDAERKMRTNGNKLCVHLPRLIMIVRLACGSNSRGSTVASALNLAHALLEFRDESAEREFLRAVGVTATKLLRDRQITEYSLNFKSLSSLEAGSYYWHSRTTLLRLCSQLLSSFPKFYEMYELPSLLDIEYELQRYASSIVMSVQYARTNTARKRRRLLGQSLLACWSTVQDFPDALSAECDVDESRSWLLENLSIALLGQQSSLRAHDLDEATELFKGGPLVGRYRDLYDPPTTLRV